MLLSREGGAFAIRACGTMAVLSTCGRCGNGDETTAMMEAQYTKMAFRLCRAPSTVVKQHGNQETRTVM